MSDDSDTNLNNHVNEDKDEEIGSDQVDGPSEESQDIRADGALGATRSAEHKKDDDYKPPGMRLKIRDRLPEDRAEELLANDILTAKDDLSSKSSQHSRGDIDGISTTELSKFKSSNKAKAKAEIISFISDEVDFYRGILVGVLLGLGLMFIMQTLVYRLNFNYQNARIQRRLNDYSMEMIQEDPDAAILILELSNAINPDSEPGKEASSQLNRIYRSRTNVPDY